MLSWWPQWRAKDAYTRVNLTYKTPTHPTPGISPFSVSQSFRPWLPFPILFKGCGEESQQSKSVWVAPNTIFIKHTLPLTTLSTVRWPTIAYRSKTNSSQLCEEDEDNRVTNPNKKVNTSPINKMTQSCSWPQCGKKNLVETKKGTCIHINPQLGEDNSPNVIMKWWEHYIVHKW